MSTIKEQHEQEKLEAKFESLGCTVLPPNIDPMHGAFAFILAAVINQEGPLTQEQIQDIIERHSNEGDSP